MCLLFICGAVVHHDDHHPQKETIASSFPFNNKLYTVTFISRLKEQITTGSEIRAFPQDVFE